MLFAKKGEILTFGVIRNGVLEEINVAVSGDEPEDKKQEKEESVKPSAPSEPRNVNLTNTTIDLFKARGMSFDDKLVVRGVDEDSDAHRFGIKPGDKLLQINQKTVKGYKDALGLVSNDGREYQLLFRRDGLDFFYKVK